MKTKASVKAVEKALNVVPVVGYDLQRAAGLVHEKKQHAAGSKRSSKGRVIVQDGVDFEALGAETADMVLGVDAEYQAALEELKVQAKQARIVAFLYAAEKISTPEQRATCVESYGSALIKAGVTSHKTRKSEFLVFLSAYAVNSGETLKAFEAVKEADAFTLLREIRDSAKPNKGKGKGSKAQSKREYAPNEASMAKVMRYIGNMTVKQLTMVYRAGQSRAKVLRSRGEMFEAFK